MATEVDSKSLLTIYPDLSGWPDFCPASSLGPSAWFRPLAIPFLYPAPLCCPMFTSLGEPPVSHCSLWLQESLCAMLPICVHLSIQKMSAEDTLRGYSLQHLWLLHPHTWELLHFLPIPRELCIPPDLEAPAHLEIHSFVYCTSSAFPTDPL